MTLRQFVERGSVGTRAERLRFEQAMLDGWADADRHGIPTTPNADVDEQTWVMAFRWLAEMRARV